MRLLVVDPCPLLARLVRHELPEGCELIAVADLTEAERWLLADPPDAAIVSLPPAHVPWREFQRLCASRRPSVPVLYESCLYDSAGAAGLEGHGYAAFLPKPAAREQLRRALEDLLRAAARERALEQAATAP